MDPEESQHPYNAPRSHTDLRSMPGWNHEQVARDPQEKEALLHALRKELLIESIGDDSEVDLLLTDAARAWVAGADTAAILCAQAAVDLYLRVHLDVQTDDFAAIMRDLQAAPGLQPRLDRLRKTSADLVRGRLQLDRSGLTMSAQEAVMAALTLVHLPQWT